MIRLTLNCPITATIATAGTAITGLVGKLIEQATPVLGFLTMFFACVTGGCIAAMWVRKVYLARKRDIRRERALRAQDRAERLR